MYRLRRRRERMRIDNGARRISRNHLFRFSQNLAGMLTKILPCKK